MQSNLFTFVCEFEGGTYLSQAWAPDAVQAVREWAAMLERERPMGAVSDRIARAVFENEETPVPISGLTGVWCWSATVADSLVLTDIILSARP
ncbi:hypothetical protein ACCC88_06045 [Sphingomonas sp. Sphisp140]|uniref:hypothetical protein n=1 Tax=unclassified Sphingomonas TaxID=196159 RepID=UPI0039AF9E3F